MTADLHLSPQNLTSADVVLGTILLGASVISTAVPEAAAIHALTAGAIGTMTLGVMTRVTRGHAGRSLEADRTTTLIFAAITLASATRVAAAFAGASSMFLLECSALLWVASFLLFALAYGPMLVFAAHRRRLTAPKR